MTSTANLLKAYFEKFPEVMQALAGLKGFDDKLYSEDIFTGGDAKEKMKSVRCRHCLDPAHDSQVADWEAAGAHNKAPFVPWGSAYVPASTVAVLVNLLTKTLQTGQERLVENVQPQHVSLVSATTAIADPDASIKVFDYVMYVRSGGPVLPGTHGESLRCS